MGPGVELEVSCRQREGSCVEHEGVIFAVWPPLCEKHRVEFYISKENRVRHPLLLLAFHTENLIPSHRLFF